MLGQDFESRKFQILLFKHIFSEDSYINPDAWVYSGVKFRSAMKLDINERCFIGTDATILVPELSMGKGSQINAGAILFGKDRVILGNNVVVGYNTVLGTATDTPKGKYMNDASSLIDRNIRDGPIIILEDCFLGANVVIMPGVTIGPRTVIGSGCYIDKNIGPNLIVHPSVQYDVRKRE